MEWKTFIEQNEQTMRSLAPGKAVKINLPDDWVPSEANDENWDMVEEIQMYYRGPNIPSDVFATLRWDEVGSGPELVYQNFAISFCRLA